MLRYGIKSVAFWLRVVTGHRSWGHSDGDAVFRNFFNCGSGWLLALTGGGHETAARTFLNERDRSIPFAV